MLSFCVIVGMYVGMSCCETVGMDCGTAGLWGCDVECSGCWIVGIGDEGRENRMAWDMCDAGEAS
jgi:hypothetical protein